MMRRQGSSAAGIDWADLRSRVSAAGRALAGEAELPAERVAELLADRARALARPTAPLEPPDSPRLISFTVAGEQYGVDPRWVMEVCRLGHLVPLPRAEPWVAGVTGWRGELVLVIHLRLLLGASASSRAERPTLVVLGEQRPLLGLLADAPGELLPVAVQQLRAPPEGIRGGEFIRGLTADAVSVLDVDRILKATGSDPA